MVNILRALFSQFVLMAGMPGAAEPGERAAVVVAGVAPFADAAAARGFLREYVPDDGLLSAIPDDKAVPFATHVKTRFDGLAKEFPASWRQLIAGDNQDHLKTLERFQSPKALYESYGAIRQKMAAGQLKEVTPFPDKGSDEEKNNWRAANGVPLDQAEYAKNLKLADGLKVSDDDKKVIENFSKAAHAAHVRPEHFQATVNWFLQEKAARTEAEIERHANDLVTAEDALRAEWGPDYTPNKNRVIGLIDSMPKEFGDQLKGARLANGTMLLNNPHAMKWLVDVSRQFNPAGVVIPGGGNMQQSVVDELAAIDKLMARTAPPTTRTRRSRRVIASCSAPTRSSPARTGRTAERW
jgi:hypothetical protein